MAKFTKEMKQRLKDQGWEFSHDYYDCITGETTIYSNKDFPGIYIMESGFGNFVIYSDNIYKTKEEKIQEAYDQGYEEAKTKFTIKPYKIEKEFMRLCKIGYSKGYNTRQIIAKMEYSLNFIPKTKREIEKAFEEGYHEGYHDGHKQARMEYPLIFHKTI